jgi:uncharacterized protein
MPAQSELIEPVPRLAPFWSGYVLRFDSKRNEPYPNGAGMRILWSCLLLEVLVRLPLREAVRLLGLSHMIWPRLVLVSTLLALTVVLTRFWIRLPFRRIGLPRWSDWTSAEKWFFPQILAVALLCFVPARWNELCALPSVPGWPQLTFLVFVQQTIWGFYQEYVYRGLLQTELVQRSGATAGILASNLLFTFGPLHAYHFSKAINNPAHLWIFPAIFAVGLYFGALFHRSRNLWIVGLLHGVGDFFIDGLDMLR